MKRTGWQVSFIYPALLGLGLGLLASCAREKPATPPSAPVAALSPPPPPRWISPPRPVPLPQEKPLPLSGTTVGGAPHRPADLIGLDEQGAARLFGAADKEIDRPPAAVWRYEAKDCSLDLYFYLDLESGRMRALRYAFRGLDGAQGSREACLTTILERSNTTAKNAAHPSR